MNPDTSEQTGDMDLPEGLAYARPRRTARGQHARTHIVTEDERYGYVHMHALCGARPVSGFYRTERTPHPDDLCSRCLPKLAKLIQQNDALAP